MRMLLLGLAAVTATLVAPPLARSQTVSIDGTVIVCPAEPPSAQHHEVAAVHATAPPSIVAPPPDFTSPACATVPAHSIDPQGRLLWVNANLQVPQALLEHPGPLGLFVLGKASSEIYLNGQRIGRNGVPAAAPGEEIVGRMDAVVFAPRQLLRAGDNELILGMSSHHGFVRLAAPIHALMLGPYALPQQRMLQYRWPALIAFGALLAGACYFTAIGAGGESRREALLLALMSGLAASQLFAEIARGLFAYSYPVHDLRLIVILVLALLFGLCLAAYVVWTFVDRRRVPLLVAAAAATCAAILLTPGFDSKSLFAVLVPTLCCITVTGVAAWRRVPSAAAHAAALAAFAAVMMAEPILFLDLLLYYSVAALLLFLFVQQALVLSEERRLRRIEAERASRLELVLEQAQAPTKPTTLKVTRTGRIERVPVDQIVSCKAAGDYVELRLSNGRGVLHDASMNELEKALPVTFLRVHRSHIVNTAYVRMLKRDPSGVGRLLLADGSETPVSRRVMPKVRSVLN